MKPLVILLHGLARGHGSMDGIAKYLRDEGFDTWSKTYPSRHRSLAELAATMTEWIVDEAGDRPLLAVTHSMGGILVRHLHDPRLRWQRIAMLAPPNRGSALAAGFRDKPLFDWFYGPAGRELGSAEPAWPDPPAPVAVIAGTKRLALGNPTSWTAGLRFGPDVAHDGTVAVEETKLPVMAAFAEVDATHTWIMQSPEVHRLVAKFLRDGSF